MPGVLWALINFLMAVYVGLWCLLWIVIGTLLLLLRRDARVPLLMTHRYWAPGLTRIASRDFEVSGLDRVDFSRPHVFVANHQSMLDVPVLIRALPVPLLFVVKEELLKVPLLGAYLRALGMIFIPRQARRKSLDELSQSARRLAEGKSILIFPEGTRSTDGRIGAFKPGAFLPIIDAGAPVVPVALDGPGRILPRGGFRVRPGKIRVAVGEPVPTDGLGGEDRKALAREIRRRTVELWQGIQSPGP